MMDSIWPFRGVARFQSRTILEPSRARQARRPARPLVLEALEPRELLSTTQGFEGTGTPYTLQQIGGPPPAAVVSAGPTGHFLALAVPPLSLAAPTNNSIAFILSDAGTYNQVIADWDFRVTQSGLNQRGLGMSFGLLNTGSFGTSGQASTTLPQQGVYTGSLGLGFDTANDAVNLTLNGTILAAQSLVGQLDLAGGQFIHATATINFLATTVSLVLTPSVSGPPVTVFDATAVTGLNPYQARVGFQASNGPNSSAEFDLDNVNVQFVGLRQAGTISFGSSTYTVQENQGFAAIDIERLGGTAGAITVGFLAADGTAKHGVNYIAVSGNVTFSEGQTTQTVDVPILDDGLFTGNKTVLLYLGNPTLQAPLAKPIQATLTILETDAVAPTVSPKVQLLHVGRSRRVLGFRLTFSQPMDPVSAQNLENYQVNLVVKKGVVRPLALSQAVLDASGLSVTLFRADLGRVHLTKLVQILVRGRPITGLKSTSGTYLAGTGGVSGTDAILLVHA
jgi:hypothetical protein